MKISLLAIKQSERLSVNEYVLTTVENDLIHISYHAGESANVELLIRINGCLWHKSEIKESDCAMMRDIAEYHFRQEERKAIALKERAQKVAASVFQF